MAIRITTLSENTAERGDFLGEWGLSILVETDEVTVLLDTGKTISAAHNADSLGVDLNKIDKVVLSHGHYDHTGGLRELLRRMGKKVEVIAHPDVWQQKYARREGEPDRYIGIPFQRIELESMGASFRISSQPVQIAKGVMTTGEIPMVTEFEHIDKALFVKEGSVWRPDKLTDDQALIVKTEQGLAVLLGCAHRGMINTLYHARHVAGQEKIYAVIGGSHLVGASEERLWQTIAALRKLGVERLGLCHCTDLPAASVLAQEFGERFFFNKAGTVVELP
ncbi:MAG: MBL fold metallo-hydrolase [Deltaproteobacteria bacterium]|nr:MBL fold metallo-hydrolase [Deltaproteobacteria bacterium]